MLGNFIQGFSISLRGLEYARLLSPAFHNNGILPYKYTCLGEGVSPPLRVESFNNSVKAFALTFGSEKRYHWVIWYIDKNLESIPENAKESKILRFGVNDFGIKGYTPPCPAKRELFKFTLYALSEIPTLKGSPTGRELIESIKDIILNKSYLFCYINP